MKVNNDLAIGYIIGMVMVSLMLVFFATVYPKFDIIPKCQEDEPLLIGVGDFDGARWDDYECLHGEALEYEVGYADGYRDASNGNSFGGDY